MVRCPVSVPRGLCSNLALKTHDDDDDDAHFCHFEVAVALVWRISVFAKWLRLESGTVLSLRSGCGLCLALSCLLEVAVARVWRTSGIGHAIRHEEMLAFASGVSVGNRKCGCGSSFVHMEVSAAAGASSAVVSSGPRNTRV